MFTDLTDAGIQPLEINYETPEIILSEQMKKRLCNILKEEIGDAIFNRATSVVKIGNNNVFFSNHWYYLAVLCKKYALALYPYCVFFDEEIREIPDIAQEFAVERFDNKQFCEKFEDEEDKRRMVKFIKGGNDNPFRPGKALINKNNGSLTIRSCMDIFGSCVLKKMAVPDASSGFLGKLIYYLAKHEEIFDQLENEVNAVIDAAGKVDKATQESQFRKWMLKQKKEDGELYSHNTIYSYVDNMKRGYNKFDRYRDYDSVFEIQNENELKEYTDYLFNAPEFEEFNNNAGNRACSCGLHKYREFISSSPYEFKKIVYETGLKKTKYASNRIVFGAPGTGKSFTINEEAEDLVGKNNENDYERVTFHPDYSYANFVGTYKPVPYKDEEGKETITYKYVPGPFMRIYVKALKNSREKNPRPFLLIIEEINRANMAAVFGDIFQLLDRTDNNISEYPIQASEDIKRYLAKELDGEDGNPDDYSEIRIPNNMFIWATMNSADQGVFPMDTAFKRRWDFKYLGIDECDSKIQEKFVTVGKTEQQRFEWNKLRKAINEFLASQNINEDKHLGPYFIARDIVVPADGGKEIDKDRFCDVFKNKVIMYLFEDAAKQIRSRLFDGVRERAKNRYSYICEEFEEIGINIFHPDILDKVDMKNVTTNNIESDEINNKED